MVRNDPEPPRAKGIRRAVAGIAALLLVAIAAVAAYALLDDDDDQPVGGAAGERTAVAGESPPYYATRIYDRVSPSIVAVLVEGAGGAGEGSGVAWDGNTIITNNHVVEGAQEVEVAFASGQRTPARVAATDPLTDLALLEVDGADLPPATFADGLPPIGAPALAIGNPLGFENSVTAGIVSGLDRAIPSGGANPALVGLIQTDAPISPGNSGGALVGPDGEVIGINVAYIPPQARAESIGFAIPATVVTHVVRGLQEHGEVEHAFLGVALVPLAPAVAREFGIEAENGAVVVQVEPGGPAADAGLRPGDVIVAVGGERVTSVEDVYAALRTREPGDRITVDYLRDGERRETTVALGRRPSR